MRSVYTPTCWQELDAFLWRHSRDEERGQFRPYVAYRGLPEDFGDLRTSLQRLGHPRPELSRRELRWREGRILDSFRKYARARLTFGHSDWDVMLLGQHYRLPTRLLDWTSSPLAALFFSTEDQTKDKQDGVIWCVRRIEAISALPRAFKLLYPDDGPTLLSLETLRERFKTLEIFDRQPANTLLWFEPPSLSPRIVGQYAFFSVMPRVDGRACTWLAQHRSVYWKVRVPASLKAEIRERLQIMNITERTMYPGLEGIARWLRSYYSGPNLELQPTSRQRGTRSRPGRPTARG